MPRRALSIFSYSRRRVDGSVQSILAARTWLEYSWGVCGFSSGDDASGAAAGVFAVVGRGSVGRLLENFARSSACMPERTSSRRSENVCSDWSACLGLATEVGAGGGGQVVLLLRCLRTGPMVWLAVGGLIRNEERRDEAADASGPVVTRLDDGRVDAGARGSRLEEDAEETCEVGAVDPCVAEAGCEVVARVDVCVMVVLWSILPAGGRVTGSGFAGDFSSLRLPKAF